MKKTLLFGSLAFSAFSFASPALAHQQPHISPFTDHLAVKLNGFPTQTEVIATYMSNNDVNISGPSYTIVSGSAVLPVQVSSHNLYERGFPSMTIFLRNLGTACRLQFVDGPYTYLKFVSGPPICPHLTISNISYDARYTYHVDLSYK